MKGKLVRTTWSPRGVWVIRAGDSPVGDRTFHRNGGGALSVSEAAMAVGAYPYLLYRLIAKRALVAGRRNGAAVIAVSELRRLRTAWKYTRPTTRMGVRA